MDETGFALDPKHSKTVDVRGAKNVLSSCSGSKQITVAACVSATGQALPPMVIWSKKTMAPDMATALALCMGFLTMGGSMLIFFTSGSRGSF